MIDMPHWTHFLDTDAPLRQHYDELSSINPLVLDKIAFHDFTVNLTFLSFTPPIRISSRWENSEPVGIGLELIGYGCQRFSTEGSLLDVSAEIIASRCEVVGLQLEGEAWVERKLQGVHVEVHQAAKAVISADLSIFKISRILPLNEEDKDRSDNPDKYA